MSDSTSRNGLTMIVTGALMLLGFILDLILVDDPFPMWLIIGGAGVMFIGVGSSFQRPHSDRQ